MFVFPVEVCANSVPGRSPPLGTARPGRTTSRPPGLCRQAPSATCSTPPVPVTTVGPRQRLIISQNPSRRTRFHWVKLADPAKRLCRASLGPANGSAARAPRTPLRGTAMRVAMKPSQGNTAVAQKFRAASWRLTKAS